MFTKQSSSAVVAIRAPAVSKRLVIVESPAKARTIAGYLGPDFVVESSVGHIRDLPQRAADIPAEYKKEKWARLGVDVEDDFRPLYVVDADKKKKVAELRALLKDADELLLATDEDREGEAIAWHLYEVLKPKVPVKRMVFHEITKTAISQALDETRDDRRAARRRAGDAAHPRPSLRLRDLARALEEDHAPPQRRPRPVGCDAAHRPARARADGLPRRRVVGHRRDVRSGELSRRGSSRLDGKRVATGRDFGPDGAAPWRRDASSTRTPRAGSPSRLEGAAFRVTKVEEKPYSRKPAAPFMTSTLQQEASRKLKFTAQTTMSLAQRLYENGYITYMRTDSTTLSESALAAARSQAAELFGAEYVPERRASTSARSRTRRRRTRRSAPRATHFRTPQQVQGELSRDEFRVYELIWMRTVASQMKDAQGRTVSLRIGGDSSARRGRSSSRASGTVITFRGFLAAYEEGRDDDRAAARTTRSAASRTSPRATPSQLKELEPQGHETNPPARYTEATLVRTLEELGIGRPSTYASIIGTILDRGYVFKRGGALVPVVPRVLGRRPARAALRAATSTTTSPPRWRTTSTASPPATRRVTRGCTASTTATATPACSISYAGSRRDRRARGQQLRDPGQRHHDSRRPLRPVPRARRAARQHPRRPRPRRADDREGRGAARAAVGRPRARRRSGDRAGDRRQDGPLRPVRHRGAPGGLEGEAAHRVALQVDVGRHRVARGRAPRS